MAKKEVAHDEAPAIISDHAFEPRGEWHTLCKHCGLAMPAHRETKIDSLQEIKKSHTRAPAVRAMETERIHKGGLVRLGYFSDDNPTEE